MPSHSSGNRRSESSNTARVTQFPAAACFCHHGTCLKRRSRRLSQPMRFSPSSNIVALSPSPAVVNIALGVADSLALETHFLEFYELVLKILLLQGYHYCVEAKPYSGKSSKISCQLSDSSVLNAMNLTPRDYDLHTILPPDTHPIRIFISSRQVSRVPPKQSPQA